MTHSWQCNGRNGVCRFQMTDTISILILPICPLNEEDWYTLSCLHGLGKQAYLGGLCQKSEAASRLTSYPGLSSLRSEWARPGRTVDATRNSLQSRTCDWLPCTLSVSNECLTDGIHALFNLPLIEVRDEQAKESIKKWSHHSLGLSQFVTGFIRRGEKAPLRLMNF